MTAIFLQQARDWADRHPEGVQGDPFAKRNPPLPGRGAQRFRMREPPSPARVVAMVGVLFGADGVTGCTGIEDEIAGYASANDRAALERAMAYERQLCRP